MACVSDNVTILINKSHLTIKTNNIIGGKVRMKTSKNRLTKTKTIFFWGIKLNTNNNNNSNKETKELKNIGLNI